MRAVGFYEYGNADVLQVLDLPVINAGEGEVRVRVHAAAINPTDILSRSGARKRPMGKTDTYANKQPVDGPPYVPGMDVAGVVDQVGDNVNTGVEIGDSVVAMVVPMGSHGGYREQIVLKANAVVPAPSSSNHVEACTLPMNALTARLSLDLLNLKAGQTLAVTGAAGAYGGYIVQLAKTEGLQVIADASDKDRELVLSLGADIVLPRGNQIAKSIRERFPSGVDGLADGAVQNELVVDAVKDGGNFTAVRGYEGTSERNINFTQTWVRSYDGQFAKLSSLVKLVEDNKLTLRVGDVFRPEDAPVAHRRLEAGGTRGRLVLKF